MKAGKTNWLEQGGNIAFAVTVIVSVAPLLWSGRWAINSAEGAILAGLAAAYIGCSLIAPLEKPMATRSAVLAVYFAVQTGLLALILVQSRMAGMVGLCVLPLVGQATACLPGPVAGACISGLFALILGVAWWIEGTARGLPGMAGGFLASFAFVIVFTRVAVREKHTRERAEELATELVAANEQLRDAAVRTEELAMARERNRLAREIHDSLGHYLTTVAVQLEAARALHATEPARALSAVEKAHGLAREALVEVRRSVGALRAEGPAQPLVERLRELAVGEAGVAVNLRIVGSARRLGPEVEHGLFRVAQEGLTNVRKHAVARSVTVTVDFSTGDRVAVEVEDDGRGCGSNAPAGGFGLTGLRERVALLGGTLTAGNGAAGGFALRAEVSA
jgi:signal transduction histidine kinase